MSTDSHEGLTRIRTSPPEKPFTSSPDDRWEDADVEDELPDGLSTLPKFMTLKQQQRLDKKKDKQIKDLKAQLKAAQKREKLYVKKIRELADMYTDAEDCAKTALRMAKIYKMAVQEEQDRRMGREVKTDAAGEWHKAFPRPNGPEGTDAFPLK